LRDMVLAASAVLTLQTAGLVKSSIHFEGKKPHAIPVEVTAAGRRVLQSEQAEA